MNLLSFCKHTIVSLIVSQIHMEFTMTSLSFSLNPYEYTFFLPNSLWIHYLFTEFTMGPIFTMDPLSFCEFSINSLYFSRTYIKFTIINANQLWIHYLFGEFIKNFYFKSEFTINSLSIPVMYYRSVIFNANSLSICYLFYETTINSLFISWFPFLAEPLWIHYLFRKFTSDLRFFREFTMHSLSFSRIDYLFIMF